MEMACGDQRKESDLGRAGIVSLFKAIGQFIDKWIANLAVKLVAIGGQQLAGGFYTASGTGHLLDSGKHLDGQLPGTEIGRGDACCGGGHWLTSVVGLAL